MKAIKKNNMRLLSFLLSFVMAASLFTGVGSTTAYADTTNNEIDLSSGNIVINYNGTYTVGDGQPVSYNTEQPLVVMQSNSTTPTANTITSNAENVSIELSGVNVSTGTSFIKTYGNVDLTVSGENTVSVIPDRSFDAAIFVYNSLNISGEGTLDIITNYIGIQAIVTVNGSRLTITGTEDSECGIYSDGRNVEINSGTVTITDVGTGIESCNSDVKMNGGTVTIASKEYGIDVVDCNVTMKDGCDLIIESEDTAINKDEESTITVDSDSQAITVYMGVSAESATSTTYTAGDTIELPTPEPPTEEGPPESNFKYFSTVAPAIEEEPDAVNWSTFKDGDYINAGTIIYNDTEDEIEIFVDTYAAAIEDELIDDDSYKNTDDFNTYCYTYYDSIIIPSGERYQVLDKYTSGSTAEWYDGVIGYEFGAERWKLYTEGIEHILYPAVRPGETPSSEGRTKPLDFVNGTEWQTGCTQSGDVWTNADENWSWNTETNTLTLSGCNFNIVDTVGTNGFMAIYLPEASTIELESETENTVVSSSTMHSAAIGAATSLTIEGDGTLDITSSFTGIIAGGNIAINSPISVKSTNYEDEFAMAIVIESENRDDTVTIADTLEITKPDGETTVGATIFDSNDTPAKEVVISAKGGGKESGTRTTALDFTEDGWKTGCTQDGNVWTNAAENWSWDTATNTLTLSGCTINVPQSQGAMAAVVLPDGAKIITAADTQNTLSNGSTIGEGSSAILGMGAVTIDGSGSLTVSGTEGGLYAMGNLAINAPISATTTISRGGMAVLGASVTIDSSLSITTPAGGKVVKIGRMTGIADSEGTFFAAEVVISANGGTETPPSGTRTTPLDFTEEADTPAWKTGCEQSEDNNAVWTNATEKWSWDTATNTLTLSGFKFVNENVDTPGFVAILLPRESHICLERGTENSVNVRSSTFCSAIGSNTSLTISGDGELDITSSYMGIMTGGNITINSHISVKSTSDDAMAILIESENQDDTITIADTLEITKPDGATFHESGKTILDSKGSFAKEVVISAKGGIAKYTVTFNATGGTLSNYTSTTNNSGKLTSLPAPTRDGYAFKGWYDAQTGGNQITTDTVFTADATIYAQWTETPKEEVYSVSGNVVAEEGNAGISNATVTIKNGTIEKTNTTKADGSFELSNIPAGEYNIVVTFGGKTVTKLVTITNSNVSGINVVIPTGDVSSVVETTGSGTPKVLVGGLDELAKAKENEGTTVEVKLTVEQKAADAVDETAKNEIVVAAAKDQLEYLDMTVNMTVDGGAPSPITNTGKVLEIIVPYDMTDKYNIAVYRHHDGQAQAFRKLTVRPTSDYQDGTFFVGDDFIVIYTSKFSYYAVGYNTTPSTPVTPPSGSSGGGGSSAPTYSISVPDKIAGGKVSISPKNAAKGATVTITVELDENNELQELIVTDKDGEKIELTDKGNGKYTFIMPAGKVLVDAVFKAVEANSETDANECPKDNTCPIYPYNDVNTTAWYHDGVHFCIEEGYMTGYPDGSFQPNTATSRAMIVSILWRMEGKPVVNDTLTFNDVKANDWYAEAVRWAASEKVVSGYSDAVFAPNDAITREQMMAILWRYSQYKGYDVSVGEDTNILSYRDFDKISGWAIPAMQWACGSGLIYGMDDNTLDAQGNATRAQAANILYRLAG